jgi:hypothetical protein
MRIESITRVQGVSTHHDSGRNSLSPKALQDFACESAVAQRTCIGLDSEDVRPRRVKHSTRSD